MAQVKYLDLDGVTQLVALVKQMNADLRTELVAMIEQGGGEVQPHTHSADDITTGVLSVPRGGTGVSSDDAAYMKYVEANFMSNEDFIEYLNE